MDMMPPRSRMPPGAGHPGARHRRPYHNKQGCGRGAMPGSSGGRTKVKELPEVTPLYKTRLCNFHIAGTCQKGSGCSFAHGHGDLRASPDFERTSVCPIMLNHGSCDVPGCRYAHKSEELRVAEGLLKTKMCSFYLNGLCVVGEACRFAHSVEELEEAIAVQTEASRAPPTSKRPNADLWELRRCSFGAKMPPPGVWSTPNVPRAVVQEVVPAESVVQRQQVAAETAPFEQAALAHRLAAARVPQRGYNFAHTVSAPAGWLSASLKQSLNEVHRQSFCNGASVVNVQKGVFHPDPGILEEMPEVEVAMSSSTMIHLSVPAAEVPAGQTATGAAAMDTEVERVMTSPKLQPVEVDRGAEDEIVELRPAHVCSHGRVLVKIDDDDDDEPLSMILPEPVSLVTLRGSTAEMQPPEPALAIEAVTPTATAVSQTSRGRATATKPLMMERVVVDIEDFGAIGAFCKGCRSRPSSSDPPLVEIRRRAQNCATAPRCILPKTESTPCSLSGRFPECALCPRGMSGGNAKGHEGCAACNCGIRVIQRNTFLEIEEINSESPAARRRSLSQ